MHQPRTHRSRAPLGDGSLDLLIAEGPKASALGHRVTERPKLVSGLSNLGQGPPAFRDHASDRLFVPSDHNLFSSRNAIQEFSEPGL